MKKYQIIYADPPWNFKNYSKLSNDKLNRRHGRVTYPTMNIQDICNLDVKNIAHKESVLFMWTTMPFLEQCFKVIRAWGFMYKTCAFVWVKTTSKGIYSGLGHWTCGNAELCLLSTTKLFPSRVSCNVKQIIMSPKAVHSKKPSDIRNRIVTLMGNINKIELFAREKTEGWDVWGNEVESDIDLTLPQSSNLKTGGMA